MVTWTGVRSSLMALKRKGEGEGRMTCRTLAVQKKYRVVADYLKFWRPKVFEWRRVIRSSKFAKKSKC